MEQITRWLRSLSAILIAQYTIPFLFLTFMLKCLGFGAALGKDSSGSGEFRPFTSILWCDSQNRGAARRAGVLQRVDGAGMPLLSQWLLCGRVTGIYASERQAASLKTFTEEDVGFQPETAFNILVRYEDEEGYNAEYV